MSPLGRFPNRCRCFCAATQPTPKRRSRPWMMATIVWWLSLFSPNVLSADLLWKQGQERPLSGWVLEQTDREVTFAQWTVGQSQPTAIETISRDQVQRLVLTVDRRRLQALQVTMPETLVAYGDELAITPDPAAQRCAVQLYLVAAYHSSGQQRYDALHKMIGLARDENERQRWSLLQLLHGGKSASNLTGWRTPTAPGNLTAQDPATAVTPQQTPPSLEILLAVLEQLRRDDRAEAKRLIEQAGPDLSALADQFAPEFRWALIQQWLQQRSLLTIDLYQNLRWQRSIRQRQQAAQDNRAIVNSNVAWSVVANQMWRPKISLPTFENATEFDPTKIQVPNGSASAAAAKD